MATWAIVHPMHNETDAKKILHELQVHVIELEMQNDELNHTRLEAENTLKQLTVINENLQQSLLERNAKRNAEINANKDVLAHSLIKLSNEIAQPLNKISEIAQKIKQTGTDARLLTNLSELEKGAQQLLQSVRSI